MEKLYTYLTNINLDVFMAMILAVLFSAEQLFTSVSSLFKRTTHLINNVLLQFGYLLLNLVLASLVISILNWANANKYGLFNIIETPYYIKVIVGIFCIDFVNYWAHRLNHTWEIFWRLHRVHHSDTIMDSTTTYRFHPLDAFTDNLSGVIAALMFGLDGSILIFWLVLYIPLLVLHHTNLLCPIGLIVFSEN